MIRFLESYGRICLPKAVRTATGIEANDQVEINIDGDSVVIRKCESMYEECEVPSALGEEYKSYGSERKTYFKG